uniref:CG2 n=1 Tax=Anisakis simplex TaxID=6269 RepID=A0A0M3K2J1_ANISI
LFMCCWGIKTKRRKAADEKAGRLPYPDEKEAMRDEAYDTRAYGREKSSLPSDSHDNLQDMYRNEERYRDESFRDAERGARIERVTDTRSAANLADGMDRSSGAGFTAATEYGGSAMDYPPPPPPNYMSPAEYRAGMEGNRTDVMDAGADFSAAAGAGNAGGVYRDTVSVSPPAFPAQATVTTTTTTKRRKAHHAGGSAYSESAAAATAGTATMQDQSHLLGLNTSV